MGYKGQQVIDEWKHTKSTKSFNPLDK